MTGKLDVREAAAKLPDLSAESGAEHMNDIPDEADDLEEANPEET